LKDVSKIDIDDCDIPDFFEGMHENVMIIALGSIYIHCDADTDIRTIPVYYLYDGLYVCNEGSGKLSFSIRSLTVNKLPFLGENFRYADVDEKIELASSIIDYINKIYSGDKKAFNSDKFILTESAISKIRNIKADGYHTITFTDTEQKLRGVAKITLVWEKTEISSTLIPIHSLARLYGYDGHTYLDSFGFYFLFGCFHNHPLMRIRDDPEKSQPLFDWFKSKEGRGPQFDCMVEEVLQIRHFLNNRQRGRVKCDCLPTDVYYEYPENILRLVHKNKVYIGQFAIKNFWKDMSCAQISWLQK
jgi:hypothetical protein